MSALIVAFLPILVLMAFPLVIPVVGVWVGALVDRLSPRTHSDAEAAVVAAQERTAAWRAELERDEAARTHAAA